PRATLRPPSRVAPRNPARDSVTSLIPRSAAARSNGSNGTAAPGLPWWNRSSVPSGSPSSTASSIRPSGRAMVSVRLIPRTVRDLGRPRREGANRGGRSIRTLDRAGGGDRLRERLDVVDVALRVLVRVPDRERPRFLLGPRRLEHAAVLLEQP